eukprot:TRINITY_DN1316_c0_g1_i1.p1 TRINITY_DN1316_c0_g1~~TRINITY_DN1316_c0_g1_i1.p1  ORF type:complete len:627 (+),score=251.81 TRINITY_DN1316_c0_g1_i1:96-1883(+)
MGDQLGKLFIEVDTLPGLRDPDGPHWNIYGFIQILFLGACYGYVLFTASGMISEGSELLLFTSFKGVVGSVILPILGAVPDGAIILFSGASQSQLAVGVGALAGSTIMLLTIPWALATIAGRVRVEDGQPQYSKMADGKRRPAAPWYKQLGCACATDEGSNLAVLGRFMLITGLSYFIIQGPAFKFGCSQTGCGCLDDPSKDESLITLTEQACLQDISRGERTWALAGLVAAAVLFLAYLVYNFLDSDQESNREVKAQDAADKYLAQGINLHGICSSGQVGEDVLLKVAEKKFHALDTNKSRDLDLHELQILASQFEDGGGRTPWFGDFRKKSRLYQHCKEVIEKSQEKRITLDQWKGIMLAYMKAQHPFQIAEAEEDTMRSSPRESEDQPDDELEALPEKRVHGSPEPIVSGEEEDDEEDEMPEDIANLPADEQMAMLWRRSLTMMLGGTGMVLLFSDPMVDVLAGIGTFLGVPSFYISFVLAPLASNAAELLSAMNYAAKQTKATFAVGVSQLLGAACMNNTFCLAIFLTQIYVNKLRWEFSAETLSIITVELLMFVMSQRSVFPTWTAIVVGALFPASIAMVYVLENIIGLD